MRADVTLKSKASLNRLRLVRGSDWAWPSGVVHYYVDTAKSLDSPGHQFLQLTVVLHIAGNSQSLHSKCSGHLGIGLDVALGSGGENHLGPGLGKSEPDRLAYPLPEPVMMATLPSNLNLSASILPPQFRCLSLHVEYD